MSTGMARKISVSFTEAEQHLLAWLEAKAGRRRRRWGISEYIKELIAEDMALSGHSHSRMTQIAAWLAKASRCGYCGSRMTPVEVRGEKVVFYCRACAVATSRPPPEEVLDQDSLERLSSQATAP